MEDGHALIRDGARHEEDARRPEVGLVRWEGLVVLPVRLVVTAAAASALRLARKVSPYLCVILGIQSV